MSPSSAITLAIAFLLGAILVPIGLSQVYAANTTGWDTTVKTIFTVLFPLLVVIGLAMRYIPRGED